MGVSKSITFILATLVASSHSIALPQHRTPFSEVSTSDDVHTLSRRQAIGGGAQANNPLQNLLSNFFGSPQPQPSPPPSPQPSPRPPQQPLPQQSNTPRPPVVAPPPTPQPQLQPIATTSPTPQTIPPNPQVPVANSTANGTASTNSTSNFTVEAVKPPWPVVTQSMTWMNRAWCPAYYNDANLCQKYPLNSVTIARSDIVNIDLFDATDDEIAFLKRNNRLVSCYFSAGSAELWRDDVKENLDTWKQAFGNPMSAWDDEIWLDIRKQDKLLPLMAKRMDYAKTRGCDIVEPDNVDCWQAYPTVYQVRNVTIATNSSCVANQSIFNESDPRTHDMYTFQLGYNMWLAHYAHSNGMAIALKNDLQQGEVLSPFFDFSVLEEIEFNEYYRKLMAPFIVAKKPIFVHQYTTSANAVKNENLGTKYRTIQLVNACTQQNNSTNQTAPINPAPNTNPSVPSPQQPAPRPPSPQTPQVPQQPQIATNPAPGTPAAQPPPAAPQTPQTPQAPQIRARFFGNGPRQQVPQPQIAQQPAPAPAPITAPSQPQSNIPGLSIAGGPGGSFIPGPGTSTGGGVIVPPNCNLTAEDFEVEESLLWVPDGGAAFCQMCRQAATFYARVFVPAQWNATLWTDCSVCVPPAPPTTTAQPPQVPAVPQQPGVVSNQNTLLPNPITNQNPSPAPVGGNAPPPVAKAQAARSAAADKQDFF